MTWFLVLILVWPLPASAQETPAAAKKFRQEQLDQILAPIALYPDPLLAQVLMASTYPLEVVLADRWIKENKDVQRDRLNDVLYRQPWDASVKALIPFPAVLAMMSEKLDWTRMVGDAFLAQEADVMDTVQQLRQKAYAANNLKTTGQQQVINEDDTIRIEPASPDVVYVPAYDPWWVYGPWWWPGYPPYFIYPFIPGVIIAPGFIVFGPRCVVGVHWGHAWGHWGWRQHRMFVNVNRSININRANINISNMRTAAWMHDPAHRRGVAYRDAASRARFGQINRGAVENRRNFRGFERSPAVPANPAPPAGSRNVVPGSQIITPGAGSRQSAPPANIIRPSGQERGSSGRMNESRPSAFTGIGQGNEVRRQSIQGAKARSGSAGGGIRSGSDGDMRGGSGGGFRGGHR